MNKRIIISESERQSILNLHEQQKPGIRNRVQGAVQGFRNPTQQPAATTTTPPVAAPSSAPVPEPVPAPAPSPVPEPAPVPSPVPVSSRKVGCASTKNPTRCNQKVLDVQVKINDKCTKITKKLIEDGIFGNNTYNSIKTCTGMDLSSEGRALTAKLGTPAAPTPGTPAGTTTGDYNNNLPSISSADKGESSMEGV
jgi:hypothetical protein